MIEFVLRAGTRNAYENLMKSHGLMKGNGELKDDVISDPAPESPEYPTGIMINEGPIATQLPTEPPYFINIRVSGPAEQDQIAGMPQYDENGILLPQYERTKLGSLVYKTGREWIGSNGRTRGMTMNNVTFLFLDSITSRKRVWQ